MTDAVEKQGYLIGFEDGNKVQPSGARGMPAKEHPSRLDMDLERFRMHEISEGVKECTANEHVRLVRASLKVIGLKRKNVSHLRISPGDLEFVERKMAERGIRSPVSYARTLAVFVSFITGNPPMIEIGSYGRANGNRALLLSDPVPGRGRVSMGGPDDRRSIEARFSKELEAMVDMERRRGFNPSTIAIHRKLVCACIFMAEERMGGFDPATADEAFLERLDHELRRFGIANTARHLKAVRILVSVSGAGSLEASRIFPRTKWQDDYLPFVPKGMERDLTTYAGYLEARDVHDLYKQARLQMVRVCCGVVGKVCGISSTDAIDGSVVPMLRKELEGMCSDCSVQTHINAFMEFASYFVGDISPKDRPARTRRLIVPETEQDARFYDVLARYEEDLRKWDYAEHTVCSRISSSEVCYRKLKEVKGDFELGDLEPYDMNVLRNSFVGYKESTVRAYLFEWGRFMEFATGVNLYEKAHLWFNGVPIERQFLTEEEYIGLYKAGGPMERLILSMGATMGLRRGEMVGIQLQDIGEGTIRIRGKGCGAEGKVVVMPISDLVARDLEAYMVFRDEFLAKFGDRSEGMLFVNTMYRDRSKPLTVRAFQTILNKLCEKAGRSFVSHSLRRMFAMTLSDAGLDLDTIRRMMRHAVVDTTLNCYLHADPRRMSLARGAVDSKFSNIDARISVQDA